MCKPSYRPGDIVCWQGRTCRVVECEDGGCWIEPGIGAPRVWAPAAYLQPGPAGMKIVRPGEPGYWVRRPGAPEK